MNKVVLITGTSTGLGLATAVLFAQKNYTVYATKGFSYKNRILQKLP